MGLQKLELICASECDTVQLGETLALALKAGDLVTLSGDLGAGKSVLARATIRAAAADSSLEVPSPTFTLMQSYDELPFGSLAHMDLYRLSSASEMNELGLDEALDGGVVLVEWPERAAGNLPKPSVAIAIEQLDDDSRAITITGRESAIARLKRSRQIRAFLSDNGHENSSRCHLTGDASTRAYETIYGRDDTTLILMNSAAQPDGPPVRDGKPYSAIAHLAEDVTAFVGVDKVLRDNGFHAPEILAKDIDAGLLLIAHLGNDFIVDENKTPIPERYEAAVEALAVMHELDWPEIIEIDETRSHTIPRFNRAAMMIEVGLLAQWYAPRRLDRPLKTHELHGFEDVWNGLIDRLADAEKSILLRDFHSPNIIWNNGAEGTGRIGLIDFQDALIGPSAYDVASLAQDARIDVPADLEARLLDRYCQVRSGFDEVAFRTAYAIMAAQRATKVLGIFVRLSKRDGKHDYLAHLPRIEKYLKHSLAHPALGAYKAWFDTIFAGSDG